MLKNIVMTTAILFATSALAQSGPHIPPEGTPPGVTRFYSDEALTNEVGFSVVGCDYVQTDYGTTGPYSSFEPLNCG